MLITNKLTDEQRKMVQDIKEVVEVRQMDDQASSQDTLSYPKKDDLSISSLI